MASAEAVPGGTADAHRILRLPEEVVNRIAAGEVVVRPVNALKELLENALDAGATQVNVVCKDGGLKLLQITDNGTGIDKEDLPLLCERFATSKLRRYEDLENGAVGTFGFRGEALASISHVSRVTVTTKTAEGAVAWRASYRDGVLCPPDFSNGSGASSSDPRPVAGLVGTSLAVEDLFYNVPTRLRSFAPGGAEEYRLVLDVVGKYAVGRAGVGFSCKKHGSSRADVQTSAGGDRLRGIASVYGNGVARELLLVEASGGGEAEGGRGEVDHNDAVPVWTLCAHISNANYAGGSKKGSFVLFINGRLVDCSPLKRAVDAVYAGVLPRGGKSFAVLCLEVDSAAVDVNVHPTKREVRFLHEEEIIQGVQSAVDEALRGANMSRTFHLSQPTLVEMSQSRSMRPVKAPERLVAPLKRDRGEEEEIKDEGRGREGRAGEGELSVGDEFKNAPARGREIHEQDEVSSSDGEGGADGEVIQASRRASRASARSKSGKRVPAPSPSTASALPAKRQNRADNRLIRTDARAVSLDAFGFSRSRHSAADAADKSGKLMRLSAKMEPPVRVGDKKLSSTVVPSPAAMRTRTNRVVSSLARSPGAETTEEDSGDGEGPASEVKEVVTVDGGDAANIGKRENMTGTDIPTGGDGAATEWDEMREHVRGRRTRAPASADAQTDLLLGENLDVLEVSNIGVSDDKEDACELTSVQELWEECRRSVSRELLDKVARNGSFVGMATPSHALIQGGTGLYMANVCVLSADVLYQRILTSFGRLQAVELSEAAPMRELVVAALSDPAWGGLPTASPMYDAGDVAKAAANAANLAVEKGPMLEEYFGMRVNAEGALTALPLLLAGFEPAMDRLPLFALRLATEVDWRTEAACFKGVAEELSRLYMLRPDLRTERCRHLANATFEGGEGGDALDAANLALVQGAIKQKLAETSELSRCVGMRTVEEGVQEGTGHLAEEIDEATEALVEDRAQLVQHVLLPAMRRNFFPPVRALHEGSMLKLTTLENLYKVFERC